MFKYIDCGYGSYILGIQCPPTIIKKRNPVRIVFCLFIEVDGVASRDEQRRQTGAVGRSGAQAAEHKQHCCS